MEPFQKGDFQRLISWIDDEESLIQFAGSFFEYPLTENQLENYMTDENRRIFRIRETASQKVIGHAEIFWVERGMVRLCRILIGEKDFRGRGLGQKSVKELVKYSFEFPQVEVVELNVYERNLPAIKCYEQVGFRFNPAQNKNTIIGNETWVSLNMQTTREDWQKTNGQPT